jgi:3-hydroxyacyl-CoA dehydrogenase
MEDVMDKPTTSPISTRKHGDVLIVLSNNPPVNALGAAVRQALSRRSSRPRPTTASRRW